MLSSVFATFQGRPVRVKHDAYHAWSKYRGKRNKRILSQIHVNRTKIGGIYTVCGNRGTMQYASTPLPTFPSNILIPSIFLTSRIHQRTVETGMNLFWLMMYATKLFYRTAKRTGVGRDRGEK